MIVVKLNPLYNAEALARVLGMAKITLRFMVKRMMVLVTCFQGGNYEKMPYLYLCEIYIISCTGDSYV